MFRTVSCAALTALLLAGCGGAPHDAHDAQAAHGTSADPAAVPAGALTVEAPWIRLPPPPAAVAAGYLTIANGRDDDRLLAVETGGAERVEIHEMRETDGIMQMRELVDGLAVPAGARTALEPGGYHLMLMAPDAALAPGGTVEGTLVFERAGRVPVTFEVRAAAGQPAGAHAGHGGADDQGGHEATHDAPGPADAAHDADTNADRP